MVKLPGVLGLNVSLIHLPFGAPLLKVVVLLELEALQEGRDACVVTGHLRRGWSCAEYEEEEDGYVFPICWSL